MRRWKQEGVLILEVAILIPAAMLLFLFVVQMALWAHAATLVEDAASQGDYAACLYGEPVADGQMEAEDVLSTNAGAVVQGSAVQVSVLSGDRVEVQVSGQAESVLPWIHLRVASAQSGAKQEFRGSP